MGTEYRLPPEQMSPVETVDRSHLCELVAWMSTGRETDNGQKGFARHLCDTNPVNRLKNLGTEEAVSLSMKAPCREVAQSSVSVSVCRYRLLINFLEWCYSILGTAVVELSTVLIFDAD